MTPKKCFVIAPIGEKGSSTRMRSDQILTHIIRPVATKFGFDVVRADEIVEPGIISTQVLERIVNDPLVIADLTERNPNVYYELAVRHATRKPVIQLMQKGEPLPFDVAGTRTIVVDHRDLDSVEDAKAQLTGYLAKVASGSPGAADSPISLALDLQRMRASNDPQQASLADIVERMTGVHGAVLSIQSFIDGGLTRRLDQLLKSIADLKGQVGGEDTAGAVAELSGSIEGLRTRLVKAVSNILDKIQEQHAELANKIQSVFEAQSETAVGTVKQSFAEALSEILPDDADRGLLLERLVELFMHGMQSMGTYQRINVMEQTEASTHAIRERINKSIEEVFQRIDKLEKQVISLPLSSQGILADFLTSPLEKEK